MTRNVTTFIYLFETVFAKSLISVVEANIISISNF